MIVTGRNHVITLHPLQLCCKCGCFTPTVTRPGRDNHTHSLPFLWSRRRSMAGLSSRRRLYFISAGFTVSIGLSCPDRLIYSMWHLFILKCMNTKTTIWSVKCSTNIPVWLTPAITRRFFVFFINLTTFAHVRISHKQVCFQPLLSLDHRHLSAPCI